MVNVVVCVIVDLDGDKKWFTREIQMPFVPFVGMALAFSNELPDPSCLFVMDASTWHVPTEKLHVLTEPVRWSEGVVEWLMANAFKQDARASSAERTA